MKTLDLFKTETAYLLSTNDLLSIRGGLTEEDPNKKTDEKPADKKDEVVYPTIDGDFDYWPEPEV
ncbi:MAG: hypothetical protein K9H64_11575 [Bacteroidales bacterium]|nr:hypothetical protein [Bacteroidales bacterium]MCF8456631.1 hypothetical protein [Bacteroidales bacterium]